MIQYTKWYLQIQSVIMWKRERKVPKDWIYSTIHTCPQTDNGNTGFWWNSLNFIHLYKFDSWDIITLSFQQHLGFIWSFPLLGNWKNKTKENFIVKLRPSTTRRQRELGKKPAGSDEPSEDAIFTFLFGYYGFQFGVDEGKASESCLVHRINEVFISMGETRLLIQELTIKVAVVTGGFLLVGG